jgi:hypothetical protein
VAGGRRQDSNVAFPMAKELRNILVNRIGDRALAEAAGRACPRAR